MALTVETTLIELDGKHGMIVGSEDPETVEFFHDRDLDGNGHTWNGVVDSIARLEMTAEYDKLDWSPEADDLLVLSADSDLLQRLSDLVQQYVSDESKMELALENADPEMID